MSASDYLENKLLDLVFNATAYSGQSTVYVKLHTGDPTDAGTSNAATTTTRAAVTFGAASSGTVTSDSDATWTNVSGDTLSHISLWDAQTNGTGNCLWAGSLTTPKTVTTGDTFTIPSGSLTVSID